MLYLLAITVGLCAAYVVLYFVFPLFFSGKPARFTARVVHSLAYVLMLSFASEILSLFMPSAQLSNRVLHVLGGGVLGILVCFFVVKDARLAVSKFQFWFVSILTVLALGIGNELLEYFLQNYFGFTFATSVNDTWLDLMSNVVGALVAATVLVPWVGRKSAGSQ